jgi:hypothetical protein
VEDKSKFKEHDEGSPENAASVEQCVQELMAKGHDKESAIRICEASLLRAVEFTAVAKQVAIIMRESPSLQAVGRILSHTDVETIRNARAVLGALLNWAEKETARAGELAPPDERKEYGLNG